MNLSDLGELATALEEIKKLSKRLEDFADSEEEIGRLNDTLRATEGELTEMTTDRDRLSVELSEAESRVSELEDKYKGDPVDAIATFLDECERVGVQRYVVPQTDRPSRAIIALYDAIGRIA
ncbi:hypothetical protein [Bradyrhizobium prioriisuperbiae]|uniref:hypothetical protein n=1 Tax=Bradyrhizobium prioriisuperbiae TaxID=2854389 RepID=UPI0028EBB389|nr:hypothetical protein [Bradyrhizobium prioritasuperba]